MSFPPLSTSCFITLFRVDNLLEVTDDDLSDEDRGDLKTKEESEVTRFRG
jgi:hypothetical protein